MSDAPQSDIRLFAIYDTATRRIEGFSASSCDQDLSDHPELAAREIDARPTPTAAGYMFDADFNMVPWVLDWSEQVRAKLVAALACYDGLIAAGFSYSGTLYQIDTSAQANLAAMGIMALGSITDPAGSPWPTGFYWISADNSHVPMDAAAMYAFGRAVAAYVSACVLRLRAIKDAIASAPGQAALDAIDVAAGYPPNGV